MNVYVNLVEAAILGVKLKVYAVEKANIGQRSPQLLIVILNRSILVLIRSLLPSIYMLLCSLIELS